MYLNNLGNLRFCVFQICFFSKAQKCLFFIHFYFFQKQGVDLLFMRIWGVEEEWCMRSYCLYNLLNSKRPVDTFRHISTYFLYILSYAPLYFQWTTSYRHTSTHFDTFFIHLYLYFSMTKKLYRHISTHFFIHLYLYFQWTTPYRRISTHFYTHASLFIMNNPLSTLFDTFFKHLYLYFQWTTHYRHISTHSLYISTCRFSFQFFSTHFATSSRPRMKKKRVHDLLSDR